MLSSLVYTTLPVVVVVLNGFIKQIYQTKIGIGNLPELVEAVYSLQRYIAIIFLSLLFLFSLEDLVE